MFYEPPELDGKPYYVPVVVKNKGMLIGYLKGKEIVYRVMEVIQKIIGIEGIMDTQMFDEYLDSKRFNNIMKNGHRETDYTTEELVEHYTEHFKQKFEKDSERTYEDFKVFEGDVLTIECTCGLGFYSFKNEEEIPNEDFHCSICQRKLIHYTDKYDYEFETEVKNEDWKEN